MSSPLLHGPFSLSELPLFLPPVLRPPFPLNYFPPTVMMNQLTIGSLLSPQNGLQASLRAEVTMKCPHCARTFETAPELDVHLLLHKPLLSFAVPSTSSLPLLASPPNLPQGSPEASKSKCRSPPVCQCRFCGKTFNRHWLLQGHIRTHTGERPFQCRICPKAFADKSNLRAHAQIHTGLKPHVCSRCGRTFALKSYLSKHDESGCRRIPMKRSIKSTNCVSMAVKNVCVKSEM